MAPRVTLEHIESIIIDESYFTAAEGRAASNNKSDAASIPEHLARLTFCVLTLKNGFTVTGESACAIVENFNEDIGRRIARDNAISKIWPLEGYLLRQRISEE